jgi:hypothetical protein
MLHKLWNDEIGFIISSELVLVATILVIGMIVGMTTIRDQVVQEMADVAAAFSDLTQSYSYGGITGHSSSTQGSDFNDALDFCDAAGQSTVGAACVTVTTAASEEL